MADASSHQPPQKFLCPISLEIMKDPIIIESGISFDRKAIETWFRSGKTTCPVSRKRVKSNVMIDNVFLKSEIQEWLEKRPKESGGSAGQGCTRQQEVQIQDPDGALRLLIELLESPNEQLQAQAAHQVCEIAENLEVKNKLVTFGAISPLIDMLSNAALHETKEAAAAALWNISTGSDPIKVRMVQCGALEPLVELLRSSRVQCQCAAAAALGTLASIESHRTEIGAAGALPLLTNLLASSSVVCRETAAAAIWEIARNNNVNQAELVAAGAVPHLVRLLITCDDFSKGSVAGALLTIAPTDSVRVQVAENGAVPALVSRLNTQVSVDDGERTAEVISLLAQSDTTAVLVVTAGAVPALVNLAQCNKDRARIIAATALVKLAVNDLNRDVIRDSGGIQVLMDLLRSNSVDVEIVGIEALAALAQGPVYSELLADAGMFRPLVSMLHGENDRLRAAAASALWNIANNSEANQHRIARTGAIGPLVQMLYSNVPECRIAAANCLAGLVVNESIRQHVVEAEAVPVLVRLLRLKPAACQERAAYCLWSLSRANPKNQKLIIKLGGMEGLTYLLETGSPECRRTAAGALLVLAPKDRTRMQVHKSGAIPWMVEYLTLAEDDLSMELYADAIANVAFLRSTHTVMAECGALEKLEGMLTLPNPIVRMSAARAIKAIKGLLHH